MTTPARYTTDDVLQELATVKPSPVSVFCFPCPRCPLENPHVARGLYTARGLAEHLADVHGEVRP